MDQKTADQYISTIEIHKDTYTVGDKPGVYLKTDLTKLPDEECLPILNQLLDKIAQRLELPYNPDYNEIRILSFVNRENGNINIRPMTKTLTEEQFKEAVNKEIIDAKIRLQKHAAIESGITFSPENGPGRAHAAVMGTRPVKQSRDLT